MNALVTGDLFRGRNLATTEFDGLASWQWGLLDHVGRLTLPTATGQRLLLVLRTIDSVSFVALYIAHRAGVTERLSTPRAVDELSDLDPTMRRSFCDLLMKLGLADERRGRIALKHPFRRPLELDFPGFIAAVQQRRWSELATRRVAPCAFDRLWRSFVFVYLLNCIREGRDVDLAQTGWCGLDERWQEIARSGRLDYEIIASGLVLELLPVTLMEKAPCTAEGQLFFAELGRQAFNAFIGHRFEATLAVLGRERRLRSAIDIGCGLGDYIHALRSTSFTQITGIERHPSAVAFLRERFAGAADVSILAEDVLSTDALPHEADLVLLIFVLLYFSPEQKLRLFRKLASVLSADGVILIGQYFPHVEKMRKEVAQRQGDYGLMRKMDILFSSKLQYAEVMLNDCSSAFHQAERWDQLVGIIEQAGLSVLSVTNADPYYYAFFLVVGRRPGLGIRASVDVEGASPGAAPRLLAG